MWRIYKRRGAAFRRMARRGEDYDGSRWGLHKSYKTEEDAKKAFALLEARGTLLGGLKRFQYKMEQKQ